MDRKGLWDGEDNQAFPSFQVTVKKEEAGGAPIAGKAVPKNRQARRILMAGLRMGLRLETSITPFSEPSRKIDFSRP
jgi:hypothetical protein